eukprot:9969302-Alexandrium_andersonii.AAC.1
MATLGFVNTKMNFKDAAERIRDHLDLLEQRQQQREAALRGAALSGRRPSRYASRTSLAASEASGDPE